MIFSLLENHLSASLQCLCYQDSLCYGLFLQPLDDLSIIIPVHMMHICIIIIVQTTLKGSLVTSLVYHKQDSSCD